MVLSHLLERDRILWDVPLLSGWFIAVGGEAPSDLGALEEGVSGYCWCGP